MRVRLVCADYAWAIRVGIADRGGRANLSLFSIWPVAWGLSWVSGPDRISIFLRGRPHLVIPPLPRGTVGGLLCRFFATRPPATPVSRPLPNLFFLDDLPGVLFRPPKNSRWRAPPLLGMAAPNKKKKKHQRNTTGGVTGDKERTHQHTPSFSPAQESEKRCLRRPVGSTNKNPPRRDTQQKKKNPPQKKEPRPRGKKKNKKKKQHHVRHPNKKTPRDAGDNVKVWFKFLFFFLLLFRRQAGGGLVGSYCLNRGGKRAHKKNKTGRGPLGFWFFMLPRPPQH